MFSVIFDLGASNEGCSSREEAGKAEAFLISSTKTQEVSKKPSDLLLPFLTSASTQLPYTGLFQHR